MHFSWFRDEGCINLLGILERGKKSYSMNLPETDAATVIVLFSHFFLSGLV